MPKGAELVDKPLHIVTIRILRATYVLLIAAAVFLLLYFLFPAVYPFFIGWLVAYILNPLVNLLQRKARFPRWLATTVSVSLFFGAVGLGITLIVNKLIVETGRLMKMIESNIGNWIDVVIDFISSDQIQGFIEQLSSFYNKNEKITETIDQNLENAGQEIALAISSLLNSLVDLIISFATKLPSMTFVLIIAILAAFFISKDWYVWIRRISPLFSEKINQSFSHIWTNLKQALFGYVRAQFIMISITAIFITVGLLILGVDYAITIGILIGLVDLLPYLGVGAAMIPWIVYVFIQGNIGLGIGLTILYAIVFVVRSIIEPKVLAFSIGMDALTTLFAMVIGLYFFGAFGIIIGPVTLVLIIALHRAHVFQDLRQYIMVNTLKEP